MSNNFAIYMNRGSGLDRCPFLSEWFNAKVEELLKMPPKPSRKGIPKGNKMPPPRAKHAFALYELLLPGFSLKKFAEDTPGGSYGTVRQWRNSEAVTEILFEYCEEFTTKFWHRIKKLIESEEINYTPITSLVEEVAFYKNDIFASGLIISIFKLINKFQATEANAFNVISASENLNLASYEREGNQEETRKVVKRILDFNSNNYELMFDNLIETIESGDRQKALSEAKVIARSVKENVIAGRNSYFLELYDLSWKEKNK